MSQAGSQPMGLGSAGSWAGSGLAGAQLETQAVAEGPGLSSVAASGSLGCGWWSQGMLGRAVLCPQDPERAAQYREQDWRGTAGDALQ